MPRALVSVSDKRGALEFAAGLVAVGWEIVSTGGTAHTLERGGVPVTPIEKVTGFAEMMDGRVKTLHPAVHGGLLARRHVPGDLKALADLGYQPIDLVAVNLYPFRETIARPDVSIEEAIEQIDIGGPSMLRSAAKNYDAVVVLVDPTDYRRVLEALKLGGVSGALRRELAAKAFTHTAAYDGAIAAWLAGAGAATGDLPPTLVLVLERLQALRYGENPHQRAAFYGTGEVAGLASLAQLSGKELSFNNLLDMDAAIGAVTAFEREVACAIIKHTTPCGLAVGTNAEEAYRRALACDPVSAFGGVVGFNTVVSADVARAMADLFVEVVVAPRFQPEAVQILGAKKNLRLIEVPHSENGGLDFKRVRSGFLVQERLDVSADESGWKVVTKRAPGDDELRDLRFAWAAVASVKSNAILLARDRAAIGIGAGQMSRVDASALAVHKAQGAGHDPRGAVLASDAFFPFRDGVDAAAGAGIRAIIQPGGSLRDPEVIAAADEHDLTMVFTGVRQFRH